LDIIKLNYMEKLREQANEEIQVLAQNELYTSLKEDIRHYGYNYSYLAGCRHSGEVSIPESYNIVKCALKSLWFELDMWPPILPILRFDNLPEWLLQLRERLHLKYDTDFVHCLSQLKRFAGYFKQNDFSRILQFGYNLGRLQEISHYEISDDSDSNSDHTIFWQPVERLFLAQDWDGLDAYIDTLQKRFQIGYDYSILAKPS